MSNRLWGGRFSEKVDSIMGAINASIGVDQRMYAEDIDGSCAHVKMLAKQGIVSDADAQKIVKGLLEIKQDIENDKFVFSEELEDIHLNIEARLTERIGAAGGRLHTARSRNDQVVTDFRLWVRKQIASTVVDIVTLQSALVERALEHHGTAMPGFTHLQSAQPVTFGHHLLAYVEMLERDKGRFLDCAKRLNECPLGAAALAGTPFPIDRFATAKELGFDKPMANSLDAVASRDFAIEALSAASIMCAHLSRLAEEFILWTTPQFGFVSLSDKFTTGSSIMPQKRNPDAAELVRGKTGRVNGNLLGLLTLMKALPMAYAKDLQEDKELTFDSFDTLSLVLGAMIGMVRDMSVNVAAMKKAASSGYSTATDLADWLVRVLGMPFREAHHVTGRIVALAADAHKNLDKLTLAELQSIEPKITENVFEFLSVSASLRSRTSYGGTAPNNVRSEAKKWIKRLEKAR